MSVQATSWVLRDGPRMTDVDRTGKLYGLRARGFRAVLITIADAANRDGEHAHPGVAAIVDGSLYSRRQALAITKELVAEAWLEVTEQGGGRGHATVYSVLIGRRAAAAAIVEETVRSPHGSDGSETVQPPHGSDEVNGAVVAPFAARNGAVSGDKQCDDELETVRCAEIAPHTQPIPTATHNVSGAEAPAAKATDDPIKARARALAVLAFEQPIKPALRSDGNPFSAVMGILEQLLRSGVIVRDIERAIESGIGVWTIAGVQTAIARNKPNRIGGPSVGDLQDAHARAAARDRAEAEAS